MKIGIIMSKDASELQRPLDYKIGTISESFAVLLELGWSVSWPRAANGDKTFVILPSEEIWEWQRISEFGGT